MDDGTRWRIMDPQDVERTLLVLFRSGVPLSASDLARTMAFGQGWLGIDEADAVVAHFIETGWLRPEGDAYLPSRDLAHVHVPLSWMPRPSRLLDAQAPVSHRRHHLQPTRPSRRRNQSRKRRPQSRKATTLGCDSKGALWGSSRVRLAWTRRRCNAGQSGSSMPSGPAPHGLALPWWPTTKGWT